MFDGISDVALVGGLCLGYALYLAPLRSVLDGEASKLMRVDQIALLFGQAATGSAWAVVAGDFFYFMAAMPGIMACAYYYTSLVPLVPSTRQRAILTTCSVSCSAVGCAVLLVPRRAPEIAGILAMPWGVLAQVVPVFGPVARIDLRVAVAGLCCSLCWVVYAISRASVVVGVINGSSAFFALLQVARVAARYAWLSSKDKAAGFSLLSPPTTMPASFHVVVPRDLPSPQLPPPSPAEKIMPAVFSDDARIIREVTDLENMPGDQRGEKGPLKESPTDISCDVFSDDATRRDVELGGEDDDDDDDDGPSGKNASPREGDLSSSCPICLDMLVPERRLELRCAHTICVKCAGLASRKGDVGLTRCPICRADHDLDTNSLRSKMKTFRSGYNAWRSGATKGAEGQLGDVSSAYKDRLSLVKADCSACHTVAGDLAIDLRSKSTEDVESPPPLKAIP